MTESTYNVALQIYDKTTGELLGDINTQTNADMVFLSDGTTLQEKLDNLDGNTGASTPFVNGTQTATTVAWTGVLDLPAIYHGLTIIYWLNYASSSTGNVSLNLTLSDGTTTGAINCYTSGTTRVAGSAMNSAGTAVRLTYLDGVYIGSTGPYTGWWTNYDIDTNTHEKLMYSRPIKCGPTTITSGEIIVGKDGLYQPLNNGLSFDITYPILISSSTIPAGGTSSTSYIYYPASVIYTQTIALIPYKPVYIKGHLSGTLFTPESITSLTQTIPTSENGYQYILLGVASTTSQFYLCADHPIYEYKYDAFRKYGELDLLLLDRLMSLSVGNQFLVGTHNGNKFMDAADLLLAMVDAFSMPDQRRAVYRGKYLGDEDSLPDYKQTIVDGEFKDLFLGDYWTINGVDWRIVDFDYWFEIGDDPLLDHHVVIMPDTVLGYATMSNTKDTTGGYYAAWPRSFGEYSAMNAIYDAFSSSQGPMLIGHLELLATGNTAGTPQQVWLQSGIDLANEPMIYGGYRLATPVYDQTGGHIDYRHTSSTKQLALFQLCPRFIPSFDNESYWLRDVTSTETFAAVGPTGETRSLFADESFGIRPVFAIG
jgi:hypothetical protein